jgi:hypothetical protein
MQRLRKANRYDRFVAIADEKEKNETGIRNKESSLTGLYQIGRPRHYVVGVSVPTSSIAFTWLVTALNSAFRV